MKKLLYLCLTVFVFLLTSAITVSADYAEGTNGENLTWTYNDGTLTISGSGEMTEPETYPWREYRDSTHTIVIESGVTTISSGAFSGFSQLTSVSMASSVRSIGQNAFSHCYRLTDAPLSDHITQIGGYAFSQCSSITSLVIPSSLTTISYGAFSSCQKLSSLTISDGVAVIESNAFSECRSLTSVTIPDSVTTIGESVFFSCTSLQSVQLSKNLTEFGSNVFSSCTSLTNISIPDGVTRIGGYSFNRCTALKNVYIGAGVSEISSTAFWKCPSLSAFSVSDTNPYFSIDRGVIYNKDKTELVLMPQGFQGSYSILPGTVKVREYACYECAGLTALDTPSSLKTIEKYSFDNCSSLQTVFFANGLETINFRAFFRCFALQSVTFPPSVTILKADAFTYCTSMTEMYFSGIAPMFEKGCFSNVTATLYYPEGKAGWRSAQDAEHGGKITWVPISNSCTDSHTLLEVPKTEPTCTASGLTAGQQCSKCGTMVVEQKNIPPLGHKYGQWVQIVAPTQSTEGLSQRSCSVCQTQEEKIIPQLTDAPQPTEPTHPETAPTQPPVDEPDDIIPTEPDNTRTEEETSEATVPQSGEDTEGKKPLLKEPSESQHAALVESIPDTTSPVQTDSEKPQDISIVFYIIIGAVAAGIIISALLQMIRKRKSV